MRNIKYLKKDKKEILENSESILYTRENKLGNFIEREVIKYKGKFYRIQAINKKITEFVEV